MKLQKIRSRQRGVAVSISQKAGLVTNANNRLQESYQLLNSVIEGISDALFVKDRSGRYVLVNEAMSQKLGKSIAEILGFNDYDLFAPELAQQLAKTDLRIMEMGEPQIIEEELLKNNQRKTYLSSKSPWRDSNGNVIGLIGVIKDITDRKQTEATLKYREWLARYFVEHTSMPAAVFDTQMRYLIVSQRWLQDYQLEGQNIIGLSHYEVFPEIPQRWKEIHQRCLAGAVENCEEDPFVRADGRIDWLRWEVRPWYEQTGAIGGIMIFTELITPRKEAEFALKQSEQRYANLTAAIPVGVYCSDTQGNVNYVNQRWCELTGLSAEQGMGKGWENALHPDDRDRITSSWCEAIHSQNIFCTEYRYQRPDGIISWVYGQAVAERAADGEIIGYIGTVTDITERKRAEDSLRENEARLRLALQATNSGIWDWDFVSNSAQVCEQYCRLLGINPPVQTVSYEHWLNCIHPDDRATVIEALNQAIEQNQDYETEYRVLHPEGIRWIASRGQVFYDAAGNLVRMLGNIQDITDRKQAEINLQENETRFRIAAESSSDLIYEWDTLTGAMQWFGDIDTQLGYEPGEIKRTLEGWETRIHPDDRPSVGSQIEQCLQTGAAFEGEYRIADRNGEYRIWLDRGRVTFDAQGKPGKWYGAITDITERKQTQEAREASEEQLRLTLEFAQIGSWDWQILENRIAWNSNHFRLMGLDPDPKEVNYETWRDRVHPDDLERVEAAIRQAIENHTDYNPEYRVIHPDGSIHWIIGKGRAIYNQSGQAVRMLGVIIDITDRKQTQEALQASEEQLRLTLEFSQIGSWAWDMRENRLTWNSKLFQLLGLDPKTAEASYHTWRDRIHPDDLERVEAAINQAIERETDYDAEHRVIHPDGTILWIIARGRAIYNQSGRPLRMLGVAIDITDRKQAELQVIQLNQSLEERVKERTAELAAANKELEAFSYSVSHDLRAPLRGIDGFSKVLLERYANQLDEKGQHYLDRIRAGTQRMGELIEDMLMLSRVTRAEMKRTSVNLSALAQEIRENLSESQPERSVQWNIDPEITVLGDGALLRIVLENLLSNAWKFTSTRTQTEIEFGLTILPENTQAYFVKDNGVGFDMSYVNKLFIAFQRLHSTNEFPGTGVGLAIVQRIIHRHGGKVWAQGIIDRGAAFYFTLG